MKTRAALLMVMLSLAAASLLAAAADVVDDDTLIRLPSDGSELGLDAGQVVAAEAATKGGSDDDNDSVHEVTPASEAEAEMTKGGEEEATPGSRNGGAADEPTRPWACCNSTVCTKSMPPTCHCMDLVDRCAAACKKCEPSIFDPSRLVCNDEYHGDPGPTCPDDDVPSAAFSRGSTSLAAAAQLLLAFGVLLFIQSQY